MKTIAALLLLVLAADARALHCKASARYDKATLVCITEHTLEVYRNAGGKKQRKVTSVEFEEYEMRRYAFEANAVRCPG